MKSKPVTITALARHLNLAIATVSYALNGRGPEMKIAEATIKRVREAADELGYQPNFFAHNLRRQKTDTIGVVFADLEENWAHRILKGMVSVFDPVGYTPLLSVHFWEKEREAREIQSFLQRKVDALICFPQPSNRDLYRQLIAQKKKLLLLGDTLPDLPEANYVAWNSGEAAATVVRHLIATGRKRIAFIGPDHRTTMTLARHQAYCDCLAEAGLPVRPEWIVWEKSGSVPIERVESLLTGPGEKPDALFVVNDGLALPLLEALDRMKISIPDQVAIASMGELSHSSHSGISLTSVHEPCEELGAELAKAALALIEQKDAEAIQELVDGNMLSVRRSSGA
jgi:LacI family transcriptional regulator